MFAGSLTAEWPLNPDGLYSMLAKFKDMLPIGQQSNVNQGQGYATHRSTIQCGTRSKKFSPKNKKNLGMICHIPLLKKAKKQGKMPLPSLGPIPLKECRRKFFASCL